LINIGAYTPGNNQRIDYAISMIDKVKTFLSQGIDDRVTIEETQNSMKILSMSEHIPAATRSYRRVHVALSTGIRRDPLPWAHGHGHLLLAEARWIPRTTVESTLHSRLFPQDDVAQDYLNSFIGTIKISPTLKDGM